MANVGSWKPDRLDTIHYIHKLAEARVGEGYSVISGCDVHEKGTPDMDVVVDSGEIFYGDVYKTVAGNNVTISAANGTHDRIDVIYVDSSGVAQVHTGDALPVSDPLGNTIWTQYESPYPKTGCPAGVIIALVYVPANDTSIENAQIEDIAQYNLIEGITTLNDNVTQADGKYIATDKIRARDGDGLQLQNAGGNGIFVENGGNVGIGTRDPVCKVHVYAGSAGEEFSAVRGLLIETSGASNSYYAMQIATVGAPAGLIFTNGGRLGIGTASPAGQLDVVGAAYISGNMSLGGNLSHGDGMYIATDKIRARDGDGLQLQDAEGNGITIANGGLITLAGHHLQPAASSNMFFGVNAGYNNTTGYYNSFVGASAGAANTTGSYNSFFGRSAGSSNTTGTRNSFFGNATGAANTTGSQNSFFGNGAGAANTTGSYNSFFGYGAGTANTEGAFNSFFGRDVGYTNTTGSENSFFGYATGAANTTGSYNSFFGNGAGSSNTTGSNLTCIGYNAQPSSASATNEITLGNSSVTTLRCKTQTITALSDRRDKTDIEPIPLGLDFIRDLKPVRWVWNCRDGSRIGDEDTGFIAQDLDDSQQKFGYEIPGLVFKPSDDRWEASSGKLLPVAIKAIQELAARVELLEAQIDA